MLSINKKKYLDLVKRTKRPDWWKISFDYSLPKDEEASAKSNLNLPLNAQSSDKTNILEMWHSRVDFLKEEKKKQEKEARQNEKLRLLKKLVGEEEPKKMVSSVQEPSSSISLDSIIGRARDSIMGRARDSTMGRARDSSGSFPIQYVPPSSYQSYNEDDSLIESIQRDILEDFQPSPRIQFKYDLESEAPENEDLVYYDIPKPLSNMSITSLLPITKFGIEPEEEPEPKTMGDLQKELFGVSITTSEIKKILEQAKKQQSTTNINKIKKQLEKMGVNIIKPKKGEIVKLRDKIYDALLDSQVFNELDKKQTSLRIPELMKPSQSVPSF